MAKNTKKSSSKVTTLASKTLTSKNTSPTAKRLAASVLSQKSPNKQTGQELESLASKVMQSEKYSDSTKTLAASVLSQSNKDR